MDRASRDVVGDSRSTAPDPVAPSPVIDGPAPQIQSLPSLILQAKLTVGPAGDRYEREADAMADRVTRVLRGPKVVGATDEPERTERRIQRAPVIDGAGGELDRGTERVIRGEAGRGTGLPAEARNTMEAAFGADFSQVKVHTGTRATQLNDQIQAKAFTTGNDIFFRDGIPDTTTAGGQSLLAHELTHTIQQGGGAQRTQRKVAKSATAGQGPIAEVPDAALTGDVEKRSSATLGLVKAGTAKADHPYVKARTEANGGKEPGSAKKFKWGVTHNNGEGHLPGVPGAGGFSEYYISNLDDKDQPSLSATASERLVVQDSSNTVFHTATHYGRDGSPAFTHLE